MKEYVTDALILDIADAAELDKTVYFYTSDLGKVVAKAKSARKITSKLIGHLQPLHFAKIRLVEKNGVQVVDAISIRPIPPSKETLALLRFIKEMTFEFQRDRRFWNAVKKGIEDLKRGRFSYRPLLQILGFAPDFAECVNCHTKKVNHFSLKEQVFLCRRCAVKIPENDLISIE